MAGIANVNRSFGMTVWIYDNTAKQVGDKDHLKVFASDDTAERGCRKRPGHGGGTDSIEIRLAQRESPFGSAEVIGRAERRSGALARCRCSPARLRVVS